MNHEILYTPGNTPENHEDEDTTEERDYGHDDTADTTYGQSGPKYPPVVSLGLAGHTDWMEPVKPESVEPEAPLPPSVAQTVTKITRDFIRQNPSLETAFQEYKLGLDSVGKQFIYTDVILEGFLKKLESDKPTEAEKLREAVSVEMSKRR